MGAGQTTTIDVNYGVSNGVIAVPSAVVWTVTGVADVPVLTADIGVHATVAVSESTNGPLEDFGAATLAFTDPYPGDTFTASYAAPSLDLSGAGPAAPQALVDALSTALTLSVAGAAGTGAVNASFNVDEGLAALLAPGQSLTATYSITLSNSDGGSSQQSVSFLLAPGVGPFGAALTGAANSTVTTEGAGGFELIAQYDGDGDLSVARGLYADGASDVFTYSAGVLTQEVQTHADKSKDVYRFNITGESNVASHAVYDAAGSIQEIDYISASGQAYSSYDVVYGADGKPASASYSNNMTATWTYNANGSYQIAYADVTGQNYTGDVVTRNANGALHDIDYSGVTGQAYSSYDVVYGADGKPVSASYSNSMTAAWTYNANGSYQIAYADVTGKTYSGDAITYNANGTIHDIDYSGVTGQAYTSYDVVYGADSKPASASYSNSVTATWTYNANGSYQIAYADVTGKTYSGDAIIYNANGTIHDIDYSGVTGHAYSSYDVVYGADSKPVSASYSNSMTAAWTYNANGSYQIAYADVAGQNYTGDVVTRNADGTVHDIDYSGVTGQAYSSYDVVYGANGKPASASYSDGMSETWTYGAGGGLEQIEIEEVAAESYTALQYDYDASGNLATTLTTNTNGTYSLVGHENGLTLDATVGPETLKGGGDDETFVFSTPFGHDTLSDFASKLSGVQPDILSLPGAAFNDSFSQLLSDTTFTNAGATMTIDPSDTIYAPGLSKSLMLASQQDFVFHS